MFAWTAGTVVVLGLLAVGLGLTVAGVGGIEVDSQSFSDSLLVGLLGQLAFGGKLYQVHTGAASHVHREADMYGKHRLASLVAAVAWPADCLTIWPERRLTI